jgi:4a-hydroxytetrahydrobiopterin dehydratase
MNRPTSENLATKTCVPCKKGCASLTEAEARALRKQTPLWKLAEKSTRLKREFEFVDFLAAVRFVNRVAEVAEAQGHHPDFAIHWNKVELVLWTHSIGGLHENDFIVAARIDRLLEEPSRPSGAVLAG